MKSKVTFPDWEAKKKRWIAQIAGRVVVNMDGACQFVVEQAKAKAPRATGRLAESITYTVEAKGNLIRGIVGVPKAVFYGLFQEMGTKSQAAHPFLRPAVYGNAKEILRILREGR